jgi:nitrogen fixation protein FixH
MDNYYSHDLAYQAHYDQITNRSLLVHDLNFVVDAEHNSITLDFGDDTPIVSAQLNFYRASDAALDFKLELKEISDKVTLSTADMEPGKWTLKVTWNDGHRDYFKSKELIIRRA